MELIQPVSAPEAAPPRTVRPRPAPARLARGAAVLLLVGLGAFEGHYAVRVLALRRTDPSTTAFMASRFHEARTRGRLLAVDHRWVQYGEISPSMKRAVLAAEDPGFFTHRGFEWVAIRKAAAANLSAGRITSGGSTISQQLAKNLFLGGTRSYARKAQEAVLTAMLEALLEKERLLELYLNVAEWGEGVFGVEAAARRYFGVAASDLNGAQAAMLAAMLPNPRYYERNLESSRLAMSSNRIYRRMQHVPAPR